MSLGGTALEGLKLHHTCECTIGGLSCLLARTGYTGELGYEIYIDADTVGRLWSLLVDKGQAWGLKPAGLGARDLLRLEMGYLLYGNDMGEETTPLEANADWTVSFQKGQFIGSQGFWHKNRPESLADSLLSNSSRKPCLATDSESSTPRPRSPLAT
jgi:aminomethyltransferase